MGQSAPRTGGCTALGAVAIIRGWAPPLVFYHRRAQFVFVTGNRPATHCRQAIAPRPSAGRKWAGYPKATAEYFPGPGSGVMERRAPFGRLWGGLRQSLPAAFTRRMTPGATRRLCYSQHPPGSAGDNPDAPGCPSPSLRNGVERIEVRVTDICPSHMPIRPASPANITLHLPYLLRTCTATFEHFHGLIPASGGAAAWTASPVWGFDGPAANTWRWRCNCGPAVSRLFIQER